MATERWKNERVCLYFAAIKKLCHCFETLPRVFLCPACISVYVRRWLWKWACLDDREEPRVINMRANDCLSIENCPGKKCRGVKGESKIWSPTNLWDLSGAHGRWMAAPRCQPRAEPCLLRGLCGESWRTWYIARGWLGWKCLTKYFV